MITLLGLGIMFIGITAVRARKISRSIGKIWIDLEIYATITYILVMWGLDLYGKYVRVAFHTFIRPEQKFGSVEELKNQMNKDKATAKAFFNR